MDKDPIDVHRTRILIVDDIPSNLNLLRETLEREGYNIIAAPSGAVALELAARTQPALILLDIMMPEMDGFETCRRLKAEKSTVEIPVIFITAKDETESLVEGFSAGGVDYITKPFQDDEVLVRVRTHLTIHQLTQALRKKNRELEGEIATRQQAEMARDHAENARQTADEQLSLISEHEAKRWGIDGFVGRSRTVAKIVADVHRLQSVGTTSVLITGESGTGKELIARAIHFGGTRAKGRFVPLNCSAIPRELAESTLFGHVRGAFTGASTSRKGCFELAGGGTLFLDEIGDMPLELQAKLLRTLEDGRFTPVGEGEEKQVDVRVLAATNADLQSKISEGTFREDLYYRLARFPVDVPALRERKEDIPLLADHFLRTLAAEMGIGSGLEESRAGSLPVQKDGKDGRTAGREEGNEVELAASQMPRLSPEALEALMNYDFPGNVRELRNLIEHALILSGPSPIRVEHLHFIHTDTTPPENQSSAPTQQALHASPGLSHEQAQALLIKGARSHMGGDVEATARLLGLSPGEVTQSEPRLEEIEMPEGQQTDEQRILAYVKQHGSISNAECRDMLNVELHRASYLLKKMLNQGTLIREGGHRWARYRLP